ncbi:MAG TPA: SGNH/GDSL hydrolase family protein [Ilumatobacteraceae bacterium]|nr:SGNH/GDSL hydrolase family protein [Ilumatobacteraceae bacterium]
MPHPDRRSSFPRILGAAIVIASAVTLAVAPSPVAAERLFVSVFIENPGPRGGVAIVGDSVMLGSAYGPPFESGWGPTLADMLADRGWGPVHMAAGVGFQAGKLVGNNPGANMTLWLAHQRSIGFDPSVIVVSIGPNDALGCAATADPMQCALDDIRGLVDSVGTDHEMWWALQTMKDPSNQAMWNQALQTVAAERPNLTLWDWPSVLASSGIPIASDNTHLPTADAYRARSALIADDVTARMGVSRQVGSEVVFASGGAPLLYRPVEPKRVLDTRETGQRVAAGGTLAVDLSVLAPTMVGADATAVAINATAAAPAAAGYLTVWDCGPQPLASSVNFLARQDRGAQATTLLGPNRTLCIFSNAATDVIVDLQGVFVPSGSPGALRFDPITPDRKLDTRRDGRASPAAIAAPVGAEGVSATLTVTGGSAAGFLAAYPCSGTVPTISNVNWQPGETVAGAAFIPVAANGTFCIFTSSPVDVIVDVTGVFGASGTLRFTPVAPTRMLDTRNGTGGWRGRQGVGQTIEIGAAPDAAVAVTGTITIVDPGLDSYLTGTICGQPPGATSSVNGARASVMANSLTVGLSPGGNLCINASVSSHTLFDTTGWWGP